MYYTNLTLPIILFLILIVYNEASMSQDEISSDEWCQSWKNLVCGSDGITYWNECLFLKTQSWTADLMYISSGACQAVECEGCAKTFTNLQYCTSNNRLVPDQCTLDCLIDEYPLIMEDFDGCTSNYPTTNEMEIASPAIFSSIIEELLSRTLAQPLTEKDPIPNKEPVIGAGSVTLEPFQGQISNNGTIFKVTAKKGWMKEITWVRMPETFAISSKKINRLMFKLKTGSLMLGYNQFSVSEASGKREKNNKIAVTIDNATLVLVVDIEADKYNCTKLHPVEVRLIEVPTIKLSVLLPVDTTVQRSAPESELDGFMKENTLRQINEAIHTTLYKRMLRVGCLSWMDKSTKPKCFGAFQRRFCSK